MKQDDAMNNLKNKLHNTQAHYKKRFNTLVEEAEEEGDENAIINMSVALYLATYFDATSECKAFYN